MCRRTLRKRPVANMAERGRDPVEERLAADEAMVGQQVGAVGEMLARAEADLEVQRPVVAEQGARADLAFGRHGDLRQQAVDQLLLALAGACARWNGRRDG
jgi:glutathione S-transferase